MPNRRRAPPRIIKDAIKAGLRGLGGYEISRPSASAGQRPVTLRTLMDMRAAREAYSAEEWAFLMYCAKNIELSNSQNFQDLFVLFTLSEKRNGFFVEFGAADGVHLSNSFIMERDYGWSGILSEPARGWKNDLLKNRRAKIDFRCVWTKSGDSLEFFESEVRELSTIKAYSTTEGNAPTVMVGEKYDVPTISLNDLLAENGAPYEVDYLSIDTEGSELSILNEFDFDKHNIRTITVEHNYIEKVRKEMLELLSGRGYVRKYDQLSLWDDWYVKASS